MTKTSHDWKKCLIGALIGAILTAGIGLAMSQAGLYKQGFMRLTSVQKIDPKLMKFSPSIKVKPGMFK